MEDQGPRMTATGTGEAMRTLVIATEAGSTYVIGPSRGGDAVRVARMSGRPVRGTIGPTSFVADAARVELVPLETGIALEVTTHDGHRLRTSPIVSVRAEDLPSAVPA